ncbi:hypothetical protein [Sulfurimonas sp.]|uniref:hypothetical protein n=1 Tax=Sulfurimonas sp. TaxID=2022749 RepID=UPI0025CBB016|nr:hypothetical protein [Sulfurimonas sp.]MDD5157608.1 hypothetical protein [Sulfurimonas sp.]
MIQDIVMILVMGVPMLLFSVYPGIKIGEYLEEKYCISERTKRLVMIIFTILFTLTMSTLLHFI